MESSIHGRRFAEDGNFRFGEFCLLPSEARLLKGGDAVALSPKAYDVLLCLCERAGGLVTKDELLDAVWGRRFISEGVVKNVVQELRQALGDNPKSPRFIETVHRRGYRFIGAMEDAREAKAPTWPGPATPRESGAVVGRATVLGRLSEWLGHSMGGQPMTVFLNGEPGIGKTTLVRRFVASLPSGVLALEGGCVEQYGQAEPYLPVLEALDRLARHDRADLVECLGRCAPIWLAQLPWLLEEPERSRLVDQTRAVTKDRMLREFGVFLQEWTVERPLLIVLEDLHWSDHATLDLIAYLARMGPRGRWMLLTSYRPVDVIVNEHPLREVLRGLRLHGLCQDLPLDLLPESAVADYLSWRFPGATFSGEAIRAIHGRTEGLPLFLVRLADELVGRRPEAGEYSRTLVEQFLDAFPEGLRLLVEMQFERLSADGRRLLEAAAVCSRDFSADALAAAIDIDSQEAEAWCEDMVRSGNLLRRSETAGIAERPAARRYDFLHAYYQELAYQGIAPTRLAELHRRVGEWFEHVHAGRLGDLAAELALHFEMGRQYGKAIEYLGLAAENAERRHASHEVIRLLSHAIQLLEGFVPPDQKSPQAHLALLARLATAIQTTQGFASPELEPIYRQIAGGEFEPDCSDQVLPLLWGAWGFYCARGRFDEAAAQVAQIEDAVARGGDPVWLIGSHAAMGGVHWHRGEFDQARRHLETGLSLYGAETRPELYPVFTQDPDVLSRFFLGMVYAMQGEPEKARRTVDVALDRGRALRHPFTEAFALWADCMLSQLLGEQERVLALAGHMHRMADEHGFTMLLAMADIFRGWAEAGPGHGEESLGLIQNGLDLLTGTGARMWLSYFLSLQADACRASGRTDACLRALDLADAVIEEHGERFFTAEIRRQRAALHAKPAESG